MKIGTTIKFTRRNGVKVKAKVKGKAEQRANGLWLPVQVEGEKALSYIRPTQAVAA